MHTVRWKIKTVWRSVEKIQAGDYRWYRFSRAYHNRIFRLVNAV